MKHCAKTGKPVSPETWGFFDKYGAVIEEMQKYAFKNHERIEIQFRGQGCDDRQTWLKRDYNVGEKEITDDITLFERGFVLTTQYEWIKGVKMTGKPVSRETWKFFDKYGAVIEEMQKYAFKNHETIEIQFRGLECGDRQTWLNRGYNVEGKEVTDDIVLFESGVVSATQYEWIEGVNK